MPSLHSIASPFLFLLLFSFLLVGKLVAQQEIGLRTYTRLSNFDFIYKKKQKSGKYIRYRAARFNFGLNDLQQNSRSQVALSLAIGKETRRTINEKLQWITGVEPRLFFSYQSAAETSKFLLSPAIGYVLGLQYQLNRQFYLNVETIPALSASFTFNGRELTRYGIYGEVDINNIALSVLYRFGG